jgi:uncharacterized RmlC-like cupin family protein
VTYAAGVSATTTGGEIVLWFGDRLEEKVVARAGDFLYIPNGVPQLPVNGNATESAVAVLARTDASHLRGTAVR